MPSRPSTSACATKALSDTTVRCLFPRMRPMVGYAATSKSAAPRRPPRAAAYLDRTDWWDYILSLPAPRVVVVQDISTKPGLGSLLGAVHMNILRALDCVGRSRTAPCATSRPPRALDFTISRAAFRFRTRTCISSKSGEPVEMGGLRINPAICSTGTARRSVHPAGHCRPDSPGCRRES